MTAATLPPENIRAAFETVGEVFSPRAAYSVWDLVVLYTERLPAFAGVANIVIENAVKIEFRAIRLK